MYKNSSLFFISILFLPLLWHCTPKSNTSSSSNASGSQLATAANNSPASPQSVQSLYTLLQQTNAIDGQLQAEMLRNQSLVTALQANQYQSCLNNVVVKTVVLQMNGMALPMLDVSTTYMNNQVAQGVSAENLLNEAQSNIAVHLDQSTGSQVGTVQPTFTIGLSSKGKPLVQAAWSHNEAPPYPATPAPLFVTGGDATYTAADTSVTIGSFDSFYINKDSVAYQYAEQCSVGGGAGNCMGHDNTLERFVFEDQRYQINQLTLLVNGITLYDAAVEHFFNVYPTSTDTPRMISETGLNLSVNITLNPAYLQALQIKNCVNL